VADVPGIDGYATEAPALLERYEQRVFDELHDPILHLLPPPPARVLDIGAGTGRDAAAFAKRGYQVTAVEPVDAMREGAMRLHPDANITWVDGGLPELATLAKATEQFDVVALIAVLMHLDAPLQARALRAIAPLIRRGGVLIMYLRHGPVPAGRTMFEVSPDEIKPLAASVQLACVYEVSGGIDRRSKPGVSWTRLAFRRMDVSGAEGD
jgi:SAM-dependent methyltransferase